MLYHFTRYLRTDLSRSATVLASVIGLLLLVTGCASDPDEKPAADPQAALLAEHDLSGLDARTIIDRLDALPVAERPTDLRASVQPDQLVLSDDRGREALLPMPDGDFYVSLAPYVSQTHECHFHSLTTCLGELRNADITVSVVDSAGTIVVSKTPMRTYDNGFVGLWLPRGIDATITVVHADRTATTTISTTGSRQPTCLTGLELTEDE